MPLIRGRLDALTSSWQQVFACLQPCDSLARSDKLHQVTQLHPLTLENLFDPNGREWCLRQGSKSTYGLMWPWHWPFLPKVERFMPLPRGPLVPIGINISSRVFNIGLYYRAHKFGNRRTDGPVENMLRRQVWPGGGIKTRNLAIANRTSLA